MTRTGRCTRSASQAIVAVLPVPVAPSSTLSLAPPLTRFSSASIASGWSPDGWKSLTIRNGATVRVNSSAGLMLSSVRLRPDSRGVRADRSGTRLDSGTPPQAEREHEDLDLDPLDDAGAVGRRTRQIGR